MQLKFREKAFMKHIAKNILVVLVASLVVVDSSFATDGYFLTGYGAKQQGRGGTGVALPGDSLAGATNPAGLIFVGDRFDFGLTLFRPIRSSAITGNQLPPGYPDVNGSYDASRVKNFAMPELGWSHQLRPNLAAGVALYGNGGLNTSYTKPIFLLGNTRGGVDLEQLFISPALAYKVGAHNSFGVAANIAYQRFSAEGLQNFANANESRDPSHVTNSGHSNSFGGGVRVGWIGELSQWLNVGATYQTRTYTSRFSRYSGLFAEGGKFDIPANFAAGAAVKLGSKATVQFDAERILYGQVKSVANSDANQAPLGAANGPGFGWHDITVIKTGLDYNLNPALTLRAGYNHAGLPFDNTQTFFNLLAPAVTQDHLHAGATWTLKSGKEINFAYIHAFNNTVNGVNSIPPSAGSGNANLSMYQNSIQVSLSSKKNKK
jgi:long-chain fatty acid transport protein